MAKQKNGLTEKEKAFIDNYIICLNGAKAARLAGYSEATAKEIAYENLTKPHIRAAVEKRLGDIKMGANEVLARLGSQASNEASEYLRVSEDGKPGVDVKKMIEDGKQYLIKGITFGRGGEPVIEFYDAQSALVHLGRHFGLFIDKSASGDEVYKQHMEQFVNAIKS